MLNHDAMAQLQGLRDQLEAQNEHTEASIKGTQHRYGFAVTDDGREVFIPPDEMLKVLPGDRVAICIRPATGAKEKNGKPGRTVAEIENLLQTGLDQFVGSVVQKGKAIFVVPDLPSLSRWLFIPPHARNGVSPGDLVECALLRHPIHDGKPSAKVLRRLGGKNSPGSENRYCAVRGGLAEEWTDKQAQPLIEAANKQAPLEDPDRVDLSHLAFVSIDSARTVDIDDALYAEVTPEGWLLSVAVADPTAFLKEASSVWPDIAQRGTSVYFHGDVFPMLPDAISQQFCSLAENSLRPALVCQMQIGESGEIGSFELKKALVRSSAKLTYAAVDRYVTGHNDELIAYTNPLEALVQVYRKLREYREQNELVMELRREFRWILDDTGQIGSIEAHDKLASQRLVEECMIAANKCAGAYLRDQGAPGPFVVHRGFRSDRVEEARTFLEKHRAPLKQEPIETLAGYRSVLADLADPEHELPLRDMVNRLLTRAEFASEPGPHMGLATPIYTNFTSPLRKALDFFVHLQINACLAGESGKHYPGDQLPEITRALGRAREATAAADRRLVANYLDREKRAGTSRFTGTVCHVSSSGFTVRLADTGLEGLVDLRQEEEKFSFDKWTMSLTSTTRRFQLAQSIEVDYLGSPAEGDYLALFGLTEGCGLKPVKEASPGRDADANQAESASTPAPTSSD